MKMKDVNGFVLQRNMMDQYKTLLNLTVSQIEDAQSPAEEQAELDAVSEGKPSCPSPYNMNGTATHSACLLLLVPPASPTLPGQSSNDEVRALRPERRGLRERRRGGLNGPAPVLWAGSSWAWRGGARGRVGAVTGY